VVHNGLISNYEDLKSELEKRGNHFFFSHTDSEVICSTHRRGLPSDSVEEAFLKILQRLEGTFGVAMISTSSHVEASLPYTRQAVPLDEGE
jgi:glucosamine--fructose-6-phosphate aminotransferase (isomerizing)